MEYFFVFSTNIGIETMELLPSQYFISRNLTFRCATKFKPKIIVCMAGWRFSCNFSISYVIVLFCNKVETKGEETIFNLKLLLGCPAEKGWNPFWNRILIFSSTSIFIHTEKFIINSLVDLEYRLELPIRSYPKINWFTSHEKISIIINYTRLQKWFQPLFLAEWEPKTFRFLSLKENNDVPLLRIHILRCLHLSTQQQSKQMNTISSEIKNFLLWKYFCYDYFKLIWF